MKEVTLVYPHQLFKNNPSIKKERETWIIEHPKFFQKYKYNKKKLILHRASMKYYAKEKNAKYYEKMPSLKNIKVHTCDLIDHELRKELKNVEYYETRMFYLQKKELTYFKNNKLFMNAFYKKQREKLDILMKNGNPVGGKLSFDEENREKLPEKIKIPKLPKFKNKYIEEAKKYVERNYKNNYGRIDDFNYPTTHKEAQRMLNDFLKKRFKNFGKYEDAISKEENYIFHSLLSSSLNIGLITPQEIVDKALKYGKNNKIPINSIEGFVRQIIGWREFIRGVYEEKGKKQQKSNFLKHKKKLTKKFWKGTTGIIPLDDCLKKAEQNAYVHHIERLMVLGNLMLLMEIKPKDVYEWFMTQFIDAYDWVMIPNVYGMSQYSDGGLMTTKPYMSGSNYILKMSNYKKAEWCDIWDGLYWRFVRKHKKMLSKNPRLAMMTKNAEKYYKKNKEKTEKFLKDL